MSLNGDYLRIDMLPGKSDLIAKNKKELEACIQMIDRCPQSTSRKSCHINELAKNNPFWRQYKNLVLSIIETKS